MRSGLLPLPTLVAALLSASCPGGEETVVRPEPPFPAVTARAALAVGASVTNRLAAKPEPPKAAASSVTPPPTPAAARGADPGLSASVSPELLDDGSDELNASVLRPTHADDELASIAKETSIYAEPHWTARRIGYLRAGAIVSRSREAAAKNHACTEGWYQVAPRGYVCVGPTATLDVFDPVVETSAKRPRRDTLPYTYVMSRFPPPPLYARLPSEDELARAEPNLAGQLRRVAFAEHQAGFVEPPPAEPIPNVLLYGGIGPRPRRVQTLTLDPGARTGHDAIGLRPPLNL